MQLEPLAFQQRHRRGLAERRVAVVQGPDGIGYVTGEVSATDAAAIEGMLAAMARRLGAEDPRTERQRRSDLFADLLLGRLAFDSDRDAEESDSEDSEPREAVHTEWLEVENIDPDTGELLGEPSFETVRQLVGACGFELNVSIGPADVDEAGEKVLRRKLRLSPQERFVRALYLAALGRPGSQAEWAPWVAVLDGPGQPRGVRAQGMVAGQQYHLAHRGGRRPAERIPLPLHDQDRHLDGVELLEPVALRSTGRVHREGQAEHGGAQRDGDSNKSENGLKPEAGLVVAGNHGSEATHH